MELSLIDTDILSEILKRQNANVLRRAGEYFAEHQEFVISAVTRYEVMRGLKHKGAHLQLKKFASFASTRSSFPSLMKSSIVHQTCGRKPARVAVPAAIRTYSLQPRRCISDASWSPAISIIFPGSRA
jgi:hypothetical protein